MFFFISVTVSKHFCISSFANYSPRTHLDRRVVDHTIIYLFAFNLHLKNVTYYLCSWFSVVVVSKIANSFELINLYVNVCWKYSLLPNNNIEFLKQLLSFINNVTQIVDDLITFISNLPIKTCTPKIVKFLCGKRKSFK